MNNQFEIIKKVWASKKILSFFKYQRLVNKRLNELIKEQEPKIQIFLQLQENKEQLGNSNKQYTKVSTKALEDEVSLLKPLILLNNRNIINNQKYLLDILSIIHYSTNDDESTYVENTLKNPSKVNEQKQLYKILELAFVILQNSIQETVQQQILIGLDSILKSMIKCSSNNPQILLTLRQYQKYSRIMQCTTSFQGINSFIKAITSFDCKLKLDLTPDTIEKTLTNVLQQLDCVICYSSMTNPVSMKCGHSFCKACMVQDQSNNQKRCPICRMEQMDEIYLSENNKFLTKLIQLKNSFQSQSDIWQGDDTQAQYYIHIKPQRKDAYENKIVLRTKQSLKYLIEEEVEIDTMKFRSLSTHQFQQLLQQHLIFILIDKNENAYLVKNILTHIRKSKAIIKVQYQDKIQIAHQYYSHIFLNIQNVEYIFNCLFATAITLEDQYIDLSKIEILKQLDNSISNIKEFFNQVLRNQQQDQTYQTILSFLTIVGFWNLQNSDIISNYDEMKKYSYLIPNILRIPEKEREKIQKTNNLIIRLQLIEESLNRFKQCSNLLMIISIPTQNKDSNRNIIIFIVVFLLLSFTLQL
ncbi:unnamed protein product (macronuclear) [Paramecium tetraurelia]|uniref:RING-type domain-containing protein n=1 Tax=Paramecium tetraurelia TaxID=5888 RepID=A0CSD3_PARTE|nr:uncharacterized protein GSPATT00009972001 [Paramecium tetraurelia]CAK73700.1 unnamed protein product [Paramecium tetraurelia]|eukprot:XP_001441097.1 hypothetical protein (macronuclear) [Paramecium tetraurelia strain d4-2]